MSNVNQYTNFRIDYKDSSGTQFFLIPQSQQQRLSCFEYTVNKDYIAPPRNKFPETHFGQDSDHSFYFSENYNFDSARVPVYSQSVQIDSEVYWQDMS